MLAETEPSSDTKFQADGKVDEVQPVEPTLKDLKAFTKKSFPEERKRTAQKIRSLRSDYFGQQREITKQIGSVETEKLTDEGEIQQATEDIEALNGEIQHIQDSVILRVLEYSKLKKLRVDLGEEQDNEEAIEKDYSELTGALQKLNEQKNNKTQLANAREVLNGFYTDHSKRWKEFREEEKSRDIENIVEKYNVVFVHAINANYVPTVNSPLNSDTDWKMKLRIALSMNPTLSCSTVQAGDTVKNMWAGMGLILKKGRVVDAAARDAATRAIGVQKRVGINANEGPEKISERVENAIGHGNVGNARYNEFVIEDAEPAGFYYCEDGVDNTVRGDLADAKEIADEISRLGLPLYVIQKGVVHAAHYNAGKNKIEFDENIRPKDIIQNGYTLSNEQKDQIEQEILENSPFKLKTEEPQLLDARAQGIDTYIKLNFTKGLEKLEGEEVLMDMNNGSYGDNILDYAKVKIIARAYGAQAKTEYVMQETTGRLFERIKRKDSANGQRNMIDRIDVRPMEEFKIYQTSITVGYYGEGMGRPILSSIDYLDGVESAITQLKIEEDAMQEEKWPGQKHRWLLRREALAFHLFGFAETAAQNSDFESQQRAVKIAEQVLSQETYADLVKRRIGPHGEFRMTKEDLQNVGV